jgi:hypothetical protein
MSNGMNEEKYFKVLKESAVQRYGEERAKLLEPAIQDVARSLAAIAEYPLEMEEEPAFFG